MCQWEESEAYTVHMWIYILLRLQQIMSFCSEVEDIRNLDCIQTPYMKRVILKVCNFC